MIGGNAGKHIPSFQQKKFVEEKIDLPLAVGQNWYLLDSTWFTTWKEYVDYRDTPHVNCAPYPGAINNSGILSSDGELRDKLMEKQHFETVPEEVWTFLIQCYGLAEGQSPICRSVIEVGMFNKTKRVEYYLLELFLSHYKDPTNGKLEGCSQSMTIGALEQRMRKLYDISEAAEIKLLSSFMSANYEPLDDPDTTITDANLQPRQFVVIVEKEGAVWPDPNQYKKATTQTFVAPKPKQGASNSNSTSSILPSSSATNRGGYSSTTTQAADNSSNGYGSFSKSNGSLKSQARIPGLCGLGNLGNTCFMSSSIQCLSNVPALTKFFRDNQWQNDLNEDNPLGMHGQIAESYAELMDQMWSGKNSSVHPRRFKGAVGRFAPRFSGYQQQDSHELMAFLLDGLHEDLNRIKKKPYVEIKTADGRPDKVVADEAWVNYKKRNNSIIIDLFHGQLKSTLRCPECKEESVIFDPFCYLAVPIPNSEKKLTICYVTSDPSKSPIKCRVKVPTDGTFDDVFEALSKLFGTPKEKMKAAEVLSCNSRFHRIYDRTAEVYRLQDDDKLFVYELDHSEDNHLVSLYFRESPATKNAKQATISWPKIISLPKETTYDKLYDTVRKHCDGFINKENESTYLNSTDIDLNNEIEKDEPTDQEKLDSSKDEFIEQEKPDMSKDEPIEQAQDVEPMEVCAGSKVANHRILFKMYFTSMYGIRESYDPLSADKTIKIKDGATISVEFSKALCGTVAVETLDLNHHTSLHESEKTEISLEDCLQTFASEEQLGKDDTWYCPKCKTHVQAYKKFALWKLPQYLVIQLKRYKSSFSSYSYYNRDKIDKLVNFPVDDLDLSDWVISAQEKSRYGLIAVSNHFGGLGGGHYTAYAKNLDSGKWYNFDDSYVSSASKDSVVTRNGYLLVYERKD